MDPAIGLASGNHLAATTTTIVPMNKAPTTRSPILKHSPMGPVTKKKKHPGSLYRE